VTHESQSFNTGTWRGVPRDGRPEHISLLEVVLQKAKREKREKGYNEQGQKKIVQLVGGGS